MEAPKFCRRGNVLCLGTTKEGRKIEEQNRRTPRTMTCATPEDVRSKAVEEVRRLGGDVSDQLSVLSRFEVQFGQYRGQTFKWLVENALGYCVYIISQLDKETGSSSRLSMNKSALKTYLRSFLEGREAVEMRRKEQHQREPETAAVANIPPRTEVQHEVEETDLTDEQLPTAVDVLELAETSAPTVPSSTRKRAVPADGDTKEYLLTEGWKQTLPRADHQWVSQALFKETAKGKAEVDTSKIDRLWFYPPVPQFTHGQPPKPSEYFASRLLMWMPRKLWAVKLVCPHQECNGQELHSAGVYPSVRQVLDIEGFYNLAAEYLECRRCSKKVISWSKVILDQLDTGHRLQFPAVLTYRLACDMTIVRMLRDRTLGNGPFQMMRKVKEAHSGAWLRKTAYYLSAVQEFVAASERGLIERPKFEDPPAMPSLPTYKWLLSVYCNDVLERIEEVKASITSTFGRILKMDSTKKITRKLAGQSAGTASWATSVGNELGQVLMLVMTAAEGIGLQEMAQGIVRRFAAAGQPTPELLYVDRGCCGAESKIFKEWPDMPVRLDVWHFMRRLARGCTTEHQLYPFFLRRLSACIFVWSADDVEKLVRAKKAELTRKNITCPSDDDIFKRIGRREMARHCRRKTRGAEETTRLIGDLLATLDGQEGRNTMGVPLFDSNKIRNIWDSQQKHVGCIQDPPGVQLYTKTGEMVKWGVTLPVYKCARGSSSVESFHLHMNRFIPGTSANDVHFQAYLMEGLHRWNCDRAADATGAEGPSHTSYGSRQEFDVNRLAEKLLGKKINPTLVAPQKYTGELIGLEYLFRQSNQELLAMDPDEGEGDDDDEDEGCLEIEDAEDGDDDDEDVGCREVEDAEEGDDEDGGCREVEDAEDPTQPPPELPAARPASSRQSPRTSRRQSPRRDSAPTRPGSTTQSPIQQPFQFPDVTNTAGQTAMKKPAGQPTLVTLTLQPVQPAASQPSLVLAQGFKILLPAGPVPPTNVPTTAPNTVPRTTLYYRKRQAQRIEEGKRKRKYTQRTSLLTCSQCHQERDPEHHHQYFGSWYCARTQTQPLQEWRTMMSTRRREKLKEKEMKKEMKKEEETKKKDEEKEKD